MDFYERYEALCSVKGIANGDIYRHYLLLEKGDEADH